MPQITRIVRSPSRFEPARRSEGGARGAFEADVRRAGLTPSVDLVECCRARAPRSVALALCTIDDVLVRQRRMYADGVLVALSTSYVPWMIAGGTALSAHDTGPGGIYSRLDELGYPIARCEETITVRPADARDWCDFPASYVIDIFRTAYTRESRPDRAKRAVRDRPVEVCVSVLAPAHWQLESAWDRSQGRSTDE